MKRVAIPVVLVAVLVVAGWVYSRSSPETAQVLPLPVHETTEPAVEHVAIAGEAEPATRTQAVETPPTVAPTTAVPSSDATPLGAGEAELVVRVLSSEEKKPLAKVRLLLWPLAKGARSGSATIDGSIAKLGEAPLTDGTGTARFVVPAGDGYRVETFDPEQIALTSADATGLAVGESRVLMLEGATRDDTHFFGRLIGDEDEQPIEGAKVEWLALRSWASEDGTIDLRGVVLLERQDTVGGPFVTDADGRFDFPFSSWKHLNARIVAAGRSLLLTDLPRRHPMRDRALTIRLHQAATLHCRVVDAAGSGIAGVTARVSAPSRTLARMDSDWSGGHHLAWQSTTGVDGRCVLVDLPARAPMAVELVDERGVVTRRETDLITLAPGEEKSIELTLGRGARVHGRVVDQYEQPVTHRAVWLKPEDGGSSKWLREHDTPRAQTRSDAEGAFSFEDVPVGDWWVAAAPRPSFRSSDSIPVEEDCTSNAEAVKVTPGVREVDVLVRTYRGLLMRGHVLDAEDKPARGASLSAQSGSGPFITGGTLDDGSFALGPLAPGEYQLVARGAVGSPESPSELTTARAGDFDVIVRLKPGGRLEGRVIDAASAALTEAMVTFSRRGAEAKLLAGMKTRLASGGRFDIGGLQSGEYAIVARTSEGKCGARWVTIEVGKPVTGLEVVVEPGATLRIRCETGSGVFSILSGEAPIAGGGVVKGQVNEQSVPAGKIVIRALTKDFTPTDQTITVSQGETREVVIQPYK